LADWSRAVEAYYNEDRVAGTKELTKLAEQGDVEAQYYLGFTYTEETGDPVDERIALKWFTRAAEQGYPSAQLLVALYYEKGITVVQDFVTAIKWYTLAAEQGNVDAQFYLARMYRERVGVKDNVRAHMWFNIAGSLGEPNSKYIREVVEMEMTPAEIIKAQKLARECVAKNYKGY
jgi:TPR repeat protein